MTPGGHLSSTLVHFDGVRRVGVISWCSWNLSGGSVQSGHLLLTHQGSWEFAQTDEKKNPGNLTILNEK